MSRLAILSVFDKTNLKSFAEGLQRHGVEFLSTGGTARHLVEEGFSVTSISDYTGHPEILDGRVKSLHPKIHGGILARKDNESDAGQLSENDIRPIDFVVVNLYPFTQKVAEIEKAKNPDHISLVEDIDIGGPTMIRAAAKNCHHVVPVCDPADYPLILKELDETSAVSLETRQRLAAKVFATMAAYDGAVARYFSLGESLLDPSGEPKTIAPFETQVLERTLPLRYGENPHQQAGAYREYRVGGAATQRFEQLQGKELSYNNFVDMQATAEALLEFYPTLHGKHAAIVVKHTNPCGVAVRPTAIEAFRKARECDPLSAFGGIIAVNGIVDAELAECMLEGFVEVILVEEVTEEARQVFAKKKNVRLMICDFKELASEYHAGLDRGVTRASLDGYLVQTADLQLGEVCPDRVVSGEMSDEMLADLQFAWRVCKHVKSNTIVIAKDCQAIGVGAGQMSRVDAAKLAIERAKQHGHQVDGAVAASDAFLPFPDTLEILNDAGVCALVQPGGSIKDADVIAAAEERNMVMVTTGERHFRH